MKFKQYCYTLFVCLIVIYGFTFVLFPQHSESDSHDKFIYSPNDTFCPVPIFNEELSHSNDFSDDCQSEFPDWIFVLKNYAIFNDTIFRDIGGFQCFYKEIYWDGDFRSAEDSKWTSFLNNTYLDNKILRVVCKGKGLLNYNEHYLMGYKDNHVNIENRNPDILIVGIDSLSRLAWKKFLSKSYKYLENEMKETSVIFKKANVLGDGTTINVLGMLSGEEETELYESRRNEKGAKEVDDYPWIWNVLSSKNYITFYDDEDVNFGTFEYRLLGFKNQPTDYYGRIWRMAYHKQTRSKLCMNQRNNFLFQIDSIRRFFSDVQDPKFAFIWSSHYSHNDNNDVEKLDNIILDLLRTINSPTSAFNNTVFVLLSDHGHRFNSRSHLQGKYEERLPFLAINIPKLIHEKHPDLVKNMKLNENKLVTPFDVHETLIDAVSNFSLHNTINKQNLRKMSLFHSNLPQRNCHDIKIPAHWCVCLKWESTNTNNTNIINSATYAIKVINQNTEEYRSKCYKLELDHIISAYVVSPSDAVIHFYKSDKDGRKADLSDNTVVDSIYYRITFKTKPGDAIFETTVNVKNTKDKQLFNVNINDIDRNNRYSSWVWCVTDKMRDVRKYCLCF